MITKIKMPEAKYLFIKLILFMLFFFFICSNIYAENKKIIKVRSDHNYPPYEFLNNGRPSGFNIDLIKAVAEVMELNLDIELGPWNEVREELEEGKIDIIAGMYFSDERNMLFDFSVPHTMVSSGLFVRENSEISSFEEIKDKEIIVQEGDIMHDFLKREGITEHIIPMADVPDAIRLLASGNHDCLLLSSEIQGLYFIDRLKLTNIKLIKTDLPSRKYCFAVSEGNKELLHKLDEGLNILKSTGKYSEIYEKWFGIYEKKKLWKDFRYYILFVLIILLLLLFSILWSRSLKSQVIKKTEELAMSEERLKLALEASNEGLVDWNVKTDKLHFSPPYYTILDYEPYEFPETYDAWKNLIHPEDINPVEETLKEYFTNKRNFHEIEFRMKSKTGKWKWILSRGKVAKRSEKGELIRLIITHIDITPRKIMEEELYKSNISLEEALKKLKTSQEQLLKQERLRALEQMGSGIAHDINNALTPVLGHCDLLSESKNLNQEEKEAFKSIIIACKDISHTVAGLRDFSRSRPAEKDLQNLNLNKIVGEVIELTKPRWKNIPRKTGILIEVTSDLEADLPVIKGIESEIREALTNIIFNAFDAMNKGGTVTVKTCSVKNRVFLEVKDTGTGMDENVKKHCLEPFFTTKGERGTGLGLAMVYGIMERHRGEIQIESSAGKGTFVKLFFPLCEIDGKPDIVQDRKAVIPSLKILCIDDEIQIIEVMKIVVAREKHVIESAESGREGISLFKEKINKGEAFDVVITDLGMPGMDGYEVVKNIKVLSPSTPVIIMTGWGNYLDRSDLKGADTILPKPFTIKDLNKALIECLGL